MNFSKSEDFESDSKFELLERFTVWITFIVSIIGLVGNACTIIVLNTKSMRRWRSSILLTALALSDFLYLSIIFLSILDNLTSQTIGLHRSVILCQTTVYITHVCSFLSSNFTLSFTMQRFVAVHFPLHAHTIISTKSSMINIFVLIFISLTYYSFSFFVTSIYDGLCKENEHFPALFPLLLIDLCLTFVIPFIFITIFNCAIVYKLQHRPSFDPLLNATIMENQHRKNSSSSRLTGHRESLPENPFLCQNESNEKRSRSGTRTSMEGSSPVRITSLSIVDPSRSSARVSTVSFGNGESTSAVHSSNSTYNRQAVSQRTTKMLVICSTVFLLFNSPYCAVLFYCFISKHFLPRTLSVLRHFYFMSFCLNFFLYSLCVHRFRDEFLLLLRKFTKKSFDRTISSKFSSQKIFSKRTDI